MNYTKTNDTNKYSLPLSSDQRKSAVVSDKIPFFSLGIGEESIDKCDTNFENNTQHNKIYNTNDDTANNYGERDKDSHEVDIMHNSREHKQQNGDSNNEELTEFKESVNHKVNNTTNLETKNTYSGDNVSLEGNNINNTLENKMYEGSEPIHIKRNKCEMDSHIHANGTENKGIAHQLHNQDEKTSADAEIIYDETKPKRIQRPNTPKTSVPHEGSTLLQEGINRLISPDEDVPVKRSPNRRRLASVELPSHGNEVSGRPIIVYNDPDSETGQNVTDQQSGLKQPTENHAEQTGEHINPEMGTLHVPGTGRFASRNRYQKSPEMMRKIYASESDSRVGKTRRCESPVLKMKSRSESSNPYNKPGRKISSDARLGGKNDAFVKPVPMRKISSHARLEHSQDSKECQVIEEQKRRRVSFGTATYISSVEEIKNNDAVSRRLSDHITNHHSKSTAQAFLPTPNTQQPGIEPQKRVEDGKSSKLSLQQDLLTQNKIYVDKTFHDGTLKSHPKSNKEAATDSPNEQYDNKAFVNDEISLENDILPKLKIIDSQTGTPMEVRKNLESTEALSSSTESLIEFQPNKKHSVSAKEQILSAHSLPNGHTSEHVKKNSYGSDVSEGPKSILKVRKDDSVSMSSTDSLKDKNQTVRRDSVALYHLQHGDIADDKRDRGPWIGISRKDFKRLWDSRYDILAKYKVHVSVFTIFLLTLIFVIVGVKLHKPRRTTEPADEAVLFDPKYRRIHLLDDEEMDEIIGTLGIEIPSGIIPSNCYLSFDADEMKCLLWKGYAELLIIHKLYNSTECYDIRWTLNPGILLHDCYEMDGAFWYGPANSSLNQWYLTQSGFSFDSLSSLGSGTFSKVTEYYWLSSKGAAIIAYMDFPVHISLNEKKGESLCISRSYKESSYSDVLHGNRHVQYRVCNGVNILETHRLVRNNFFPKFSEMPDKSLLVSPHWSLTPEPKTLKVNDSDVMDIVTKIIDYKLNCSTVDLDWQWEMKYGDFSFDKRAFSEIERMLQYLSSAGCGMTLKIYPYVNYLSENFKEGLMHRYFVKTAGGNAPVLLRWEHGVGAMIDITNADAQDWFSSKLRNLITSYKIHALRFGYGNSFWLPSNAEFYAKTMLPNEVMTIYSKFINSFTHVVLERTSQTQNIPSLISIPSEIVRTEEHTCLRNVVPLVLTLGMLGYPFLISDGFKYDHTLDPDVAEFPSKELFIRWMQLSTFFPAMRYTVKPWYYDDEVIQISQNLTRFHQNTVLKITDTLKDEIHAGEPIIRPMWWSDPSDENTYPLDDQFMLGNDVIVAPILCEGKAGIAERNIYFPKGIWRDSFSKALINGPIWIQYYKVMQNQTAFFTREVLFQSVK